MMKIGNYLNVVALLYSSAHISTYTNSFRQLEIFFLYVPSKIQIIIELINEFIDLFSIVTDIMSFHGLIYNIKN